MPFLYLSLSIKTSMNSSPMTECTRISAMVYVDMSLLISPFGWIAGQLSSLNRSLPFALNMGLFAIGIILVTVIGKPGFLTLSTDTLETGRTEFREIENPIAEDTNGAL
jgi:hypothetical protein